jgi:hypothetical protein
MSSANNPIPPDREEFENPLDVLPFVEKAKAARKFLNTRRAILAGERLYNLTQSEIKPRGLLGPWAFNAAKSIVVSIPGIVVGGCIAVVWPLATSGAHDPLQEKIGSALAPLMGPIALLMAVYAMAYACLPTGYVTKKNWKAAQRKYLFLDGAYGFWPQFFIALSTALVRVPAVVANRRTLADDMQGIGLELLSVGLLWQCYAAYKIKAKLTEYDYLRDRPEMFAAILGPSTLKYYLLMGFALPIVLLGLFAILLLIEIGLPMLVHHLL